jgi:hypothetical protein
MMFKDGPGGALVVRMIDVLFIMLFGYIQLAEFHDYAETDMPIKGAETTEQIIVEQEPIVFDLTVNDEKSTYRYKLIFRGRKGWRLPEYIGEQATAFDAEADLKRSAVRFNNPDLFREALSYRTNDVGDRRFEVHISAKSKSLVRDVFRLVDECASFDIRAEEVGVGETKVPPRVRFSFKSWEIKR